MPSRLSVSVVLAVLSIAAASGQPAVMSFPDTTHNVGVEAILAPIGTIDSGQTVIPRCIVANYGDSTASLSVYMAIDGGGGPVYLDSLVVPELAPAQRETVEFGSWMAGARDSMTAISWTLCESDTFPADDTAKVRFLVRVVGGRVDLGFFLPETLDSGVPILPQARAWNYGNQSLWGYLKFRVDSTYYFRSVDVHLIPGGATILSAGDSWFPLPRYRVMACSLFVLPADTCIARALDTVWVRGTPFRDAAVTRLWRDSLAFIHAEVVYFGDEPASLWSLFRVCDSLFNPLFKDSLQHVLGPQESTEAVVGPVPLPPGLYVAACTVAMAGEMDSTNNVKYLWFRVPQGAVAEESHKPQASSPKPIATVVRGVLRLEAYGTRHTAYADLLDAQGRTVLALHPGANDASGLSPGVYFVRAVSGELSAVSRRKVVLLR